MPFEDKCDVLFIKNIPIYSKAFGDRYGILFNKNNSIYLLIGI